MNKSTFPIIGLALAVTTLAAEDFVLSKRLSRAEAVASAVVQIDNQYMNAQADNAALRERLSMSEAAGRADLKDAVADHPKKPKRPKKVLVADASRPALELPGYNGR